MYLGINEIDAIKLGSTTVDKIMLGSTKVWPLIDWNVDIETDGTGDISFIIYNGGAEVDWGSGSYTTYSAGTITGTPTDTVKIKFGTGLNRIKFANNTTHQNRYTEIHIRDATQLTSAQEMCRVLPNMTAFSMENNQNIGNYQSCWYYNRSLLEFPQMDFTNGTNFDYTWYYCDSLTSFGDFKSNGIAINSTWLKCSGLESIGELDIPNCWYFGNAFNGCTDLVCLTNIDTTIATRNTGGMFTGCTSLTSPSSAEQTSILAGYDYVNSNACP